MLLIELVHLLPCLLQQVTCSSVPSFPCPLAPSPVSSDKQPVHPSTRPLINLQCYSSNLFICYPVSSCHQRVPLSPFPLSSYPVNTIYYPLMLPLYVNYFYHLTFLSVLFQNTATQILPFLSPTSTVKNVTINKPSH